MDADYVCRAFAQFQYQHRPALVFEDEGLVPLDQLIPGEGLSLEDWFTVALKLCACLASIHRLGLSHRDFNPSNVVCSEDFSVVKLIDFEHSSTLQEQTDGFAAVGELQGTLAYIAPEQTGRVNHPVDQRCDLYALGASLYQLACGKLLFQEQEVSSLIYAHIAQPPPSVTDSKPDWPAAVDQILQKLLEKEADQRYQDINDLLEDLGSLQTALKNGEDISTFKVKDSNLRLARLGGRIFGREKEKEVLFSAYELAKRDVSVLSICGASGIGKTALIRELFRDISKRQGFYISGKFDQLNKGYAYTAFVEAFSELAQQCMQDKPELWAKRLRNVIADDEALLLEMVPAFSLLLGKSQQVSSIERGELTFKRDRLFARLFSEICQQLGDQGRELVMFVDDLQWADPASLDLLAKVLAQRPKGLLLLLSYRDAELSLNSCANDFVLNLPDKIRQYRALTLEALSKEQMSIWLSSELEGIDDIDTLVQQVYLRTQGNPYYIKSFLEKILDQEILSYKNGQALVDWSALVDLPVLSSREYMRQRVEGLADVDREHIQAMSVLGNKFSAALVCDLFDIRRSELADLIRPLLAKNLLLKSSEVIFFSHDSVQQAAASLLEEEKAESYCLILAQRLAQRHKQESDEGLQHYLHFYNRARRKISAHAELYSLIEKNLMFAKSLMAKAAYSAARGFLIVAIEILDEVEQLEFSELRAAINVSLGLALINLNEKDEGLRCLDWVIENSPKEKGKIEAYIAKLNYLSSAHHHIKADKVLNKLLMAMEVGLPKNPTMGVQIKYLLGLFRYSLVRNPKNILKLDSVSDDKMEEDFEMLSSCLAAAYICGSDYYPLIVMHMFKLTIKYGVGRFTPIVLISFAIICLSLGRWNLAKDYADVALELLPRYPDKFVEMFVHLNHGCLINHWFKPMRESEFYLNSALSKARDIGNFEMVGLAGMVLEGQEFVSGERIQKIMHKQLLRREHLRQYNGQLSLLVVNTSAQVFATMSDSDSDGVTVSGPDFSESIMPEVIVEQGESVFISGFFCDKGYMLMLQRRFSEAFGFIERAFEGSLMRAVGSYYHPHAQLAGVLISIECIENSFRPIKARYLLRRMMSNLKTYADQTPENFRGKYLIATARQAQMKKSFEVAMRAYQDALDVVSVQGPVQDRALLSELYGRFLLAGGFISLAYQQIGLAFDHYQSWGANPKLNSLREEFAFLREDAALSGKSVSESVMGDVNATLNMQSLTRSIELLSGSLDESQLLAGLTEALLVNSGASRAAFLEYNGGTLEVSALQEGKGNCQFYESGSNAIDRLDLPTELLLDALEDGGQEVLSNYQEESKSRSVCIMPLRRQQRLLGLLYLENRLLNSAFRPDHLPLLRLLAGQAAIALENSRAFAEVERERGFVKSIINNLPMMVFELGRDATIQYVNPETCKVSGFSEAELLGSNWWSLLHAGQDDELRKQQARLVSRGQMQNYEFKLETKNKQEKIILWTSMVHQQAEKGHEILLFGVDSTDAAHAKQQMQNFNAQLQQRVAERTQDLQESLDNLQRTQDKLVESEKTAALSGLVAGVAHEINTPIGVGVTGATQFLDNTKSIVKQYEAGSMSQERLESYFRNSLSIAELTHNNLQRAAELVKSFKQISVDQTSEARRRFLLKEYLEETLLSLHSQYSHRPIEVRVSGADNIEIDSYPGFYSQVLTNLLMNSLSHAFGDEESGLIRFDVALQDEQILLDYRDDGAGISPENLKRVFDPFFTTNHQGGGTGLGLNILYNLVTQNLKGEVECNSELGQGVHFAIRLPKNLPSNLAGESNQA